MTKPLRTDIDGAIARYFEQPAPRSTAKTPLAGWRISTEMVVLWLFAVTAPLVVGVLERPLLGAGIAAGLVAVSGLIEWRRRTVGNRYFKQGVLTRGRVAAVRTATSGHGRQRKTTHTLEIVYRLPNGELGAGRMVETEPSVFVRGANSAVCYVVYEPQKGNAALVVPGGSLEFLEPMDVVKWRGRHATDAFVDDRELERNISTAMGQVPSSPRVAALLTFLIGIFFAMTALTSHWFAASVIFGVWLAFMLPLVWLRRRQRNVPLFGDEAMILHDRYVPYDQVVAVQPGGVRLRTGEDLRFWAAPEQADSCYLALSEHLEAYRANVAPQIPAALKPADRAPRDWTRDVRQLLSSGGAGRFRVASITREALWEIASNVRSNLSARAAAAVALSSEPEEEDGNRWLRLAESAANKPLQRIFEDVAAAEDEEVLAAAIAEVEEAERQTSR